MSHECVCTALFPTPEALNTHLAEFQYQQSYHLDQLNKCRTHIRVIRQDALESLDPHEESVLLTLCPHYACKESFHTRPRLQRHFTTHVNCHEVCVFCHQVFKTVSKFINHARAHKDETGRKADYMTQTAEELTDTAQSEFRQAQQVLRVQGRKRPFDEMVETDVVSQSHGEHADVAHLPLQSAFDGMQATNVESIFSNQQDSIQEFRRMDCDRSLEMNGSYNAPLLGMISSVPPSFNYMTQQ